MLLVPFVLTENEFLKLCKLSKLSFSDEEKASFLEKLNEVFGFIETLKDIDTSGVDINSIDDIEPSFERDDIPHECNCRSDILSNSKSVGFDMFSVPKVVE